MANKLTTTERKHRNSQTTKTESTKNHVLLIIFKSNDIGHGGKGVRGDLITKHTRPPYKNAGERPHSGREMIACAMPLDSHGRYD